MNVPLYIARKMLVGSIDAPRKFVSLGLYRYMRNPMHLGVGISFHLFVLIYEEPHPDTQT